MMRFDNGQPWGTCSPVPSAMALWLAGLGIQPQFGRPRRSTDNAIVERAHGVLNGWVDPTQCADFAQLCRELARFATLQRERYPLADGRSRLEHFPDLLACPRSYVPTEDQHLWSAQRMVDYLATFRFQRKVEINGRITLLHQTYSVGRAHKRRMLAIQLDASTHEWVVYEDDGSEIRRFTPKNLSYASLFHLSLASCPPGET